MTLQTSDRRSNALVFGLSSLLFVMLLCCVVFAVWRASRQHHQAECVLRISRQSGAGTVDGIHEYMTFKETQAALLKSSLVLKAAAKNPKVAAILAHESDPVRYLNERVQVDLAGESELLRVRLRGGGDPETMCIVLDGVVDTYLKSISEDEARRQETLDIVQSLISVSTGADIDENELRSRIELLPESLVRDRLRANLDTLESGGSSEIIVKNLKSTELMLGKPRIQVVQRAVVPTLSGP